MIQSDDKEKKLIASMYGKDLIQKMQIIDGTDEHALSMHEFILDNITEGVFIIQNAILKYINKYAETIFGYSRDKMIGENALEFVHEDDLEFIKNIHSKRMNGEINKTTYEYRMVTKSKKTIWVLAHAITINWDHKPAALQFVIDITEKKKKEQELIAAYDIINQSTSAMFIWRNEEGWPVEFVTKNVKKIIGYKDEDFITNKISYSEIIHQEDIERVSSEVKKYSKEKNVESFIHEPYRIIKPDGEIIWIEDKTVIERDSDGNIKKYKGIIQDINIRKKTEDEREHLICELQEALHKIKTLEGLIPICLYCKSIRNDEGYWNEIEEYVSLQENAHFSHGICPTCMEKLKKDQK